MKTVFYRIDERFIHSQIIHGWIPFLMVTRLIGISRKIANDPESTQIYLEALPEGVIGSVITPEKAAKNKLRDVDSERLMVLFSSLQDAVDYCKAGGYLGTLNLGGIYSANGREEYLPYLHLSQEEKSIVLYLGGCCSDVYCQDTPKGESISISEIFESKRK